MRKKFISESEVDAKIKTKVDELGAAIAPMEGAMSQALSNESTRAQTAEQANSAADAARAQTQATTDAGQNTALSNEVTARTNADTAEATNRVQGDATNKAAIDANTAADASRASTQTTKDAAQDAALSSEATTRQNADTANASAITANSDADTARATAQGTRDTSQEGRLTTLEGKVGTWDTYSSTSTNGATSFDYTFPSAYKVAPFVRSRDLWVGDQKIEVGVISVTTTKCTIIVKRSKGTLLLSSGPFETAPQGTAFSIDVFGVKA